MYDISSFKTVTPITNFHNNLFCIYYSHFFITLLIINFLIHIYFSHQQKELQIRKQFRETCKTQTKQYKRYKAQILQTTPKDQQKEVIKQLKEEKHRKLTLLGEQVCT